MNTYLERYIENLTGRTFIKTATQIENKLFIFFYNSFQEFSGDRNTKITEEDYQEYFTQSSIEKILVGEPARIMREFPYIDQVEITMPGLSVDINREDLNKYLGFKIEETSIYNDSWRNKFSDVYIHSKDNRKRFIDNFAIIER